MNTKYEVIEHATRIRALARVMESQLAKVVPDEGQFDLVNDLGSLMAMMSDETETLIQCTSKLAAGDLDK